MPGDNRITRRHGEDLKIKGGGGKVRIRVKKRRKDRGEIKAGETALVNMTSRVLTKASNSSPFSPEAGTKNFGEAFERSQVGRQGSTESFLLICGFLQAGGRHSSIGGEATS